MLCCRVFGNDRFDIFSNVHLCNTIWNKNPKFMHSFESGIQFATNFKDIFHIFMNGFRCYPNWLRYQILTHHWFQCTLWMLYSITLILPLFKSFGCIWKKCKCFSFKLLGTFMIPLYTTIKNYIKCCSLVNLQVWCFWFQLLKYYLIK